MLPKALLSHTHKVDQDRLAKEKGCKERGEPKHKNSINPSEQRTQSAAILQATMLILH